MRPGRRHQAARMRVLFAEFATRQNNDTNQCQHVQPNNCPGGSHFDVLLRLGVPLLPRWRLQNARGLMLHLFQRPFAYEGFNL